MSNVQWAPAASGARRALNFDVYLPNWPTTRFTAQYQTNFVQAFNQAFEGKGLLAVLLWGALA